MMMLNVVKYFGCTYGELARRPGVREAWDAHVRSEPEAALPRGSWRAEAQHAVDWLRSTAIARAQPSREERRRSRA